MHPLNLLGLNFPGSCLMAIAMPDVYMSFLDHNISKVAVNFYRNNFTYQTFSSLYICSGWSLKEYRIFWYINIFSSLNQNAQTADFPRFQSQINAFILPYILRMAQGTKCLHAIWNYMRKVKLKYQHVFGTNTRIWQPFWSKNTRDKIKNDTTWLFPIKGPCGQVSSASL